jgi:hypothetical protein
MALAETPTEAVLHLQSISDPATAHSNLAAMLIEQGKYADARKELDLALGYNKAHTLPAIKCDELINADPGLFHVSCYRLHHGRNLITSRIAFSQQPLSFDRPSLPLPRPIFARGKYFQLRSITDVQKMVIIADQNCSSTFCKRCKLPILGIWHKVELAGKGLAQKAILFSEKICHLAPRQRGYLRQNALSLTPCLSIPDHAQLTRTNLLHYPSRSTLSVESSCNKYVRIEDDGCAWHDDEYDVAATSPFNLIVIYPPILAGSSIS